MSMLFSPPEAAFDGFAAAGMGLVLVISARLWLCSSEAPTFITLSAGGAEGLAPDSSYLLADTEKNLLAFYCEGAQNKMRVE